MNKQVPAVAIVVAAGSGSRLGADVPKALVEIDGVAMVRRCLDALAEAGVTFVVVTVPASHEPEFRQVLEGAPVPLRTVVGGARRQDSVSLGAHELANSHPDDAVVLVHDAARPLVPAEVVSRVATAVGRGASAVVPTVAVVDSIRELGDSGSRVVDRSRLRAVQTPQGFRLGTLLEAHRRLAAGDIEVTDDAAAAELLGHAVTLVEGHRDAMKITERVDMVLAHAILAGRQ